MLIERNPNFNPKKYIKYQKTQNKEFKWQIPEFLQAISIYKIYCCDFSWRDGWTEFSVGWTLKDETLEKRLFIYGKYGQISHIYIWKATVKEFDTYWLEFGKHNNIKYNPDLLEMKYPEMGTYYSDEQYRKFYESK